jgi:hypothetical protein
VGWGQSLEMSVCRIDGPLMAKWDVRSGTADHEIGLLTAVGAKSGDAG